MATKFEKFRKFTGFQIIVVHIVVFLVNGVVVLLLSDLERKHCSSLSNGEDLRVSMVLDPWENICNVWHYLIIYQSNRNLI